MNSKHSEKKLIRNKYSPQFKDQAVERASKGDVPQVVPKILVLLNRCCICGNQKASKAATLENQKLQQAEMARLRRECARLL